jgi:hypothetical protein
MSALVATYQRAPGRRLAPLATSNVWYDLAAGVWQQTRRDLAHGWRVWQPLPTPAMPEPVPRTLGLDAFWWLWGDDFAWWCDAMPDEAPPEAYRRVLLAAWPTGSRLPPPPGTRETAAQFRARCLSSR